MLLTWHRRQIGALPSVLVDPRSMMKCLAVTPCSVVHSGRKDAFMLTSLQSGALASSALNVSAQRCPQGRDAVCTCWTGGREVQVLAAWHTPACMHGDRPTY